MPSIVLAEASWYGSIRAGVQSAAHADGGSSTSVAGFGSRWGIMGSSEASEGLTAVYRYERGIDSTNAGEGGRLSYVGLSGGFGSITIGQVWSASYNHFGASVDKSGNYGNTTNASGSGRIGSSVSYAVTVGNLSLQADVTMDSSTKKTGDSYEIGGSLGGLMETGSLHFAHVRHADGMAMMHDTNADDDPNAVGDNDVVSSGMEKSSTNAVSVQYGIGGMTMHLGVGRMQTKNDGCHVAATQADADQTDADCASKNVETSTFAGVGGSVGDTGVNYVFQMTKNKSKTTDRSGMIGTGEAATTGAVSTMTTSSTPFTFGISRSLGGGATVYLEHHDSDTPGTAASTAAWLQVDF